MMSLAPAVYRDDDEIIMQATFTAMLRVDRLDVTQMITDFMESSYRLIMDEGYRFHSAGTNVLESCIKEECSEYPTTSESQGYTYDELIWIANMYIHIRYEAKMLCKDIIEKLPVPIMRKVYKQHNREAVYKELQEYLKV